MNIKKLEKAKQEYKKRKGITNRVTLKPLIIKGLNKPSNTYIMLNGEKKIVFELSNGDLEIL